MADIAQQEVMRRIRKLANTPSEQVHAFVTARAFFRWAARNRMIERSPLEGQTLPASAPARDHILEPHELAAVYKQALVHPYRLHDLRRTFSSTLASFGTPIHVTEKLLNHVTGSFGGVAGVYNRHTYMDEMRDATTTYEQHLEKLIAA